MVQRLKVKIIYGGRVLDQIWSQYFSYSSKVFTRLLWNIIQDIKFEVLKSKESYFVSEAGFQFYKVITETLQSVLWVINVPVTQWLQAVLGLQQNLIQPQLSLADDFALFCRSLPYEFLDNLNAAFAYLRSKHKCIPRRRRWTGVCGHETHVEAVTPDNWWGHLFIFFFTCAAMCSWDHL